MGVAAGTGPFGLEPFGHGPDLVEQGGHAGHELVNSAEQLFTYASVLAWSSTSVSTVDPWAPSTLHQWIGNVTTSTIGTRGVVLDKLRLHYARKHWLGSVRDASMHHGRVHRSERRQGDDLASWATRWAAYLPGQH